jgi:predicted esterase
VIHGYGQLAQYFIRKFNILQQHRICVIAPEGLSRFYLEDVSSRMQSGNNRVGATWMTRENRLMDIDNYIQYLTTLYQAETHDHPSIPVTVLGFSQGAATASRWVTQGGIPFSRLILWAGIFPPDINFESGHALLKDKETFLVYGKQDPFLNDSRFAEMEMLSSKLAIQPARVTFDGGHDIDEGTLLKFV